MSAPKYDHPNLSVANAFDFDPKDTSPVGYVYNGKLSNKPLANSFKIRETPDAEKDKDVVAVIKSAICEGKETSHLEMVFGVNDTLHAELKSSQAVGMEQDDLELEFKVSEYDPVEKKWYNAFKSEDGKALIGALLTSTVGKSIERELKYMGLSDEVADPRVHLWYIKMKIQGAQKICGASSFSQKWMGALGTAQA